MAFPVQTLLNEISKTLRDEWSFDFDQATELLPLLNLGIADVCWRDPLASVINASFTCAPGSLQVLPGDAVALVDIKYDLGESGTTPLTVITKTPRDDLDAARPTWPLDVVGVNGAPATIVHYTNDDRDPRRFYLWPAPASSVRNIQVIYSQAPDDVLIGGNFPIPYMYAGAVKLYVLARALASRRQELNEAQFKLIAYYQSEYTSLMKDTVLAIETQVPRDAVGRS